MAVDTLALAPPRSLSLWVDRARALLQGLGYAVALNVLLVSAWTIQASFNELVDRAGASAVLRAAYSSVRHHVWDMFPGPLFVVVCVNLAPRAGARRFAWLLSAALLCALWRQLAKDPGFQDPMWIAGFVMTVVEAGMTVVVCAYHTHVQQASYRLLRTQIDRTTLDTELNRAQLQLSRAQIEPHFLFNTLAVLRAVGRSDGPATVEMLDRLICYFRAALPRLRREQVALADEMQLIDAYLGIYQVRMGERLSYDISLPPELAGFSIPSMICLTLVENALKHGVGPLPERGFIRVSATHESSAVLLRVADSGGGIRPRDGCGMGLANVRQRLLMSYGDAAGLSLSHSEPRGVVATISIPCEHGS
jgi:hypothetical protein